MVGSAVVRRLANEPVGELITATSAELDLTRQERVERFVVDTRPDVLILAAAKVGGIHANRTAQGAFLYDNLMIAANAVEAARLHGVAKTVILGSSCIYPRDAAQPMAEEALLTGPLEETNEGYAIAKIAALELAKMYRRQYQMDCISLMPTNLYGPGDNFDLETSHVLPALLRQDPRREGHRRRHGHDLGVGATSAGVPACRRRGRRDRVRADPLLGRTASQRRCRRRHLDP